MTDNPFGKKNDLDSFIQYDNEGLEETTVIDDELKNKKKKNKIIALSVAGLVLLSSIGVISGVALNNNSEDNDSSATSTSSQNDTTNDGDGSILLEDVPESDLVETADGVANPKKNFFEEDGKEFPIKLEDWQLESARNITVSNDETNNEEHSSGILGDNAISDEIKSSLYQKLATTDVDSASNTLPSEKSGYTSDDSKEIIDGIPNPDYSYWTKESFQADLGNSIERLINPIYGGWAFYQYSENNPAAFDVNIMSDMFTNDYLEKHSTSNPSNYIPVFADWNSNDYGMGDILLTNGSRWMGEVIYSDTEFVYNDDTNSYNVNYTAQVRFVAWSVNQETLEKYGTLKLKLVPNNLNQGSSSHKVLIDDASLVME